MPGQGRAQWYDRSSTTIYRNFSGFLTQHAETVRFTYVVPLNRAFRLGGASIQSWRKTAGSASSSFFAGISLDVIPFGTSYLAFFTNVDIAIGAREQAALESGLIIPPDSVFNGITVNTDTIGDTWLVMYFYGTEYDV